MSDLCEWVSVRACMWFAKRKKNNLFYFGCDYIWYFVSSQKISNLFSAFYFDDVLPLSNFTTVYKTKRQRWRQQRKQTAYEKRKSCAYLISKGSISVECVGLRKYALLCNSFYQSIITNEKRRKSSKNSPTKRSISHCTWARLSKFSVWYLFVFVVHACNYFCFI